jgi:CRP-like cAMP-binding protein
MPKVHHPKENHLLSVLPEAEWKRIEPHLTLLDMPLGQVVYESGDRLDHVYFPTTAIISLLYVMEDGASAEIAIVGNEGLVGIALFMGGETTPSRAVVQSAGHAYRLDAHILKEEFHRAGPVQRLLLRYTQALIANMLGVRRPGVTEAATKLQDAGLIRYSYGHIEVLDRPGLEKRVCECYGVVKREFDRLLPDLRAI